MKITVVKEFTFDAAHHLPLYDGKCKNLHGHTYKLQIGVQGDVSQMSGMVLDFIDLKMTAAPYIRNMDHQYLNEVFFRNFPCEIPTAENMVIWLVENLKKDFCTSYSALAFVRLYETPTSYAEWRAE